MEKTIFIISGISLPSETTEQISLIACKHSLMAHYVELHEGTVEGCRSCGKCIKRHKCMFDDVNQAIDISDNIVGIAIISPFYYGQPASHVKRYLDRLFHSASDKFSYRPIVIYSYTRAVATTDPSVAFAPYITLSELSLLDTGISRSATDHAQLYDLIDILCQSAQSFELSNAPVQRDFSFLR